MAGSKSPAARTTLRIASLDGMLYGVPVGSTIAAGRVLRVDASCRACCSRRRRRVRSHQHRHAPLADTAPLSQRRAYVDETRAPLSDDAVAYYGQYVALVVAADARIGNRRRGQLVRVTYAPGDSADCSDQRPTKASAGVVSHRGDPDKAFAAGGLQTRRRSYRTPVETHNPIELHATVASWDGDSVTLS